jgi:hypothetical protein
LTAFVGFELAQLPNHDEAGIGTALAEPPSSAQAVHATRAKMLDLRHPRLLRGRGERPRSRHTAEKRDERAPFIRGAPWCDGSYELASFTGGKKLRLVKI